jgi:polysaccharide biosynthesis transport protein
MFSGKGDKSSGRSKSLLRLAEEQIAHRRDTADPRARLDQIAFPDVSILSDAEKHRRARAKRERVDNPLLGELGNRPEPIQVEALREPPSEPPRAQVRPFAKEPTPPAIPSVLEQFARIDADLRARAGTARRELEPAAAVSSAPDDTRLPYERDWKPLVDPRHVFDAVRRLKGLLVLCTALGTGLGLIQAVSMEKLYYSTAEVKVGPLGLKVVDNGLKPEGFVAETFAIVDSQLGIIRSPQVIEKVVDDQNLSSDPEFNGDREAGWLQAITQVFQREDANADKKVAAVKKLGERLYAERGAKTFNINITVGSEDPDKAALLAGAIVRSYVAEQRELQSRKLKAASKDLAGPLEELKKQLEQADRAVERYRAENDLVGVDGRMIDDEAILRANDLLSAAKGQTIAANAKAQSVKEITVKGVVDGAVPEELNSTVLNTLRGQHSLAKQKLDGISTRLGDRHPERVQAETELQSIRASITTELRRVSAAMQSDLKRSIQTEQDLAARLTELKEKQGKNRPQIITLRQLESEADELRRIVGDGSLRARQADLSADVDTADIELIGPPRPPEEPVGTSRKLVVAAGILGGFALGLALAVLKGVFDSLRSQVGGAGPARRETPEPTQPDGGGGGMFQPRQQISVAEEVRNTLNALKARTAPAVQQASEPARASLRQPATGHTQSAPGLVPQPVIAQVPFVPAQPFPPQNAPQPHWQQAPQPAFAPNMYAHPPVQPGPMMYTQPGQPSQQPAFVPQQPMFGLQAVPQAWPPMMPQIVQMPAAPLYPFAPEPAPPATQAPTPQPAPQIFNIHQTPSAPVADTRLDDIQRSIEEFRSALTDFSRRKSA